MHDPELDADYVHDIDCAAGFRDFGTAFLANVAGAVATTIRFSIRFSIRLLNPVLKAHKSAHVPNLSRDDVDDLF